MENIASYIAELVKRGKKAQKEFERTCTTQRAVDEVVRATGMAVGNHGRELAEADLAQTGMGNIEGKIRKLNNVALGHWNFMRGKKTVGVIAEPEDEPGVQILAKPMGVIGCVMPSTNPTGTIIGNAMAAFKCRNAVIVAPHPASAKVSLVLTDYIRQALKQIGAPEDLIQCIGLEESSIEATTEMLKQCDANIGTGGAGMVKAVYSAGKPGFGVGPGNCQAIIDEDYDDMNRACLTIAMNRSFEFGIPCTSEQTIHVPEARENEFLSAMEESGGFIIEDKEMINQLRELIFPDGQPRLNRAIVGKPVQQVGEMLGITIPDDKRVICVRNQAKGSEDLLCKEILFPFVRYTTYKSFEEAVDTAVINLEMEGAGHSSSIWTHNQEHIDYAANLIPVGRFHINQPCVGRDNGVPITVTIGCGTWGNNSISENLQYYHLMNKTRVTKTLTNKRQARPSDWDEFGICPVVED